MREWLIGLGFLVTCMVMVGVNLLYPLIGSLFILSEAVIFVYLIQKSIEYGEEYYKK